MQPASARYTAIDFWQGLKTAAAIALVPVLALTVPSLLAAGGAKPPAWIYLWGACAGIIAALPRQPALLREAGASWRAPLLICVFALGLFPLLAAQGADAHGWIGSALIAGMFGSVFAAAAHFSMQARQRGEQVRAAAMAADRTPAPPPSVPHPAPAATSASASAHRPP